MLHTQPIKLTSCGLIRITGEASEKFLQGQLTCDVREVTSQQSCLGAHCDPKGRVQFLFRLFKWQEHYYFFLDKNFIPHALQLLQKYAVFSKVKLEDVSAEYEYFGFLDAKNAELKNISPELPKEDNAVVSSENFLFTRFSGNPERFLLISEAKTKLVESYSSELNSWYLAEIQAGIPAIDLSTAGEFTPHDLNLPQLGAVSFNKGCYTGQEIVARMQYLGKLKNHLYEICYCAQEVLPSGTKIKTDAEQEIGKLVCTALKENNNYQGLAVLQDNAADEKLFIKSNYISFVGRTQALCDAYAVK